MLTTQRGQSGDAFLAPDRLRRFNRRLISAFLGYRNEFVRTNWASIGAGILDAAP